MSEIMSMMLWKFRDHVNGFKNSELSKNQALSNWALGIAGESGEVVDCIKKSLFHGKGFTDLDPVSRELGDLLWYIFALAGELDLSVENIMQQNIDKLQARHEGKTFDIEAANKNKTLEVDTSLPIVAFVDWAYAFNHIGSDSKTVIFNSRNFDQIAVINHLKGNPLYSLLNKIDETIGGDWLDLDFDSDYVQLIDKHYQNKDQ